MRSPAEDAVIEGIEDAVYERDCSHWYRMYGKPNGISEEEFIRLWYSAEITVTWDGVKR